MRFKPKDAKTPKAAKGGWSSSPFLQSIVIGLGKLGYLVPLYTDPETGAKWYSDLISLRQTYPNVPMIVVLDNNNYYYGSGVKPVATSTINSMRALGIKVLGYVFTKLGTRNLIGSDSVNGATDGNRGVEQGIDAWALYSLDGIFLDNMAGTDGPAAGWPGNTLAQYYSAATAYAKGKGYTTVIGNSGWFVAPDFIGTVDIITSIETPTLPTATLVASRTTGTGGVRDQWGMIVNNNPAVPTVAYLQSIQNDLAWVYASDQNDYGLEPSYQATMLANLSTVNGP